MYDWDLDYLSPLVSFVYVVLGVMTGDAYLFDRLGGFSGGVLLDEPLLPASSLTRNTRNTRSRGWFRLTSCGVAGPLVCLP